jgi:hypothetical protein
MAMVRSFQIVAPLGFGSFKAFIVVARHCAARPVFPQEVSQRACDGFVTESAFSGGIFFQNCEGRADVFQE